jgi:adenylate cyclase, class 2
MSFTNVEIKARTLNADYIRDYLFSHGAEFRGKDLQTDTYFNVPKGRLKLRQGNIENSLIFYERENREGPKESNFHLYPVADGATLRALLAQCHGVKAVVEKEREIYFIGNIKFHLDKLGQLGNFVEIEASNKYSPLSLEELYEQCQYYVREFSISSSDMVNFSYSDMILQNDSI